MTHRSITGRSRWIFWGLSLSIPIPTMPIIDINHNHLSGFVWRFPLDKVGIITKIYPYEDIPWYTLMNRWIPYPTCWMTVVLSQVIGVVNSLIIVCCTFGPLKLLGGVWCGLGEQFCCWLLNKMAVSENRVIESPHVKSMGIWNLEWKL